MKWKGSSATTSLQKKPSGVVELGVLTVFLEVGVEWKRMGGVSCTPRPVLLTRVVDAYSGRRTLSEHAESLALATPKVVE